MPSFLLGHGQYLNAWFALDVDTFLWGQYWIIIISNAYHSPTQADLLNDSHIKSVDYGIVTGDYDRIYTPADTYFWLYSTYFPRNNGYVSLRFETRNNYYWYNVVCSNLFDKPANYYYWFNTEDDRRNQIGRYVYQIRIYRHFHLTAWGTSDYCGMKIMYRTLYGL